jgi:hypothetical protein
MVRSFPVRFAMIDSNSTVVLVFQLLFPDSNWCSLDFDAFALPNQAAARRRFNSDSWPSMHERAATTH